MAKRKQIKNRKQVKRQTRHFQLRVEHPIDSHVGEILDFAKSQRREVTVIRDSVRLFWALENNDLSLLFDMFPHLKPQIAASGGSGAGGSELAKEIAAQIVLMGGTQGYVMQSTLSAPQKPIVAPPVAESKQAVTASADEIADNFMTAFM